MLDPFFTKQWVVPFYINILHGNYCGRNDDEQSQFILDVSTTLPKLTPEILSKLLDCHGWRYTITGSWFAGVLGAAEHQQRIGALLLESKTCFAGQAHALAMACFGGAASRDYLKRYLDEYLNKTDCFYDQHWAMPALMWIDESENTDDSMEYLKVGGLWDHWAKANGAYKIEKCKSKFWACMEFIKQHFK